MSTLYQRNEGKTSRIPVVENPSYKWGGGGLVSTPTDLVRLAQGYYEGFLSQETVELMWTEQSTAAGDGTGVGIGWRIGKDAFGHEIRHHSGSMGGARTCLVLYPEEKSAIAIKVNASWNSDIQSTASVLYHRPSRNAEVVASLQEPKLKTGDHTAKGTFKHHQHQEWGPHGGGEHNL